MFKKVFQIILVFIFMLSFNCYVYSFNPKPKMEWLKLNGSTTGITIAPNDTVKIKWHGISKDDKSYLSYQLSVNGKCLTNFSSTTEYERKFTSYDKKYNTIKVIAKSYYGKTDSIIRYVTIKNSLNSKPKIEWVKLNGNVAPSIEIHPHDTVKIKWHATDEEDDELQYDVSINHETAICEESTKKSRTYRFEEAKTYTFKIKCEDDGGKTDTVTKKIKVKPFPNDHKPKMEWIKINGSTDYNIKIPLNTPVKITWYGTDQEDSKLNYRLFIDNEPVFDDVWNDKKSYKTEFDESKLFKIKVICQDSGGKTDTITKSFKVTNNKPKMEWLKLNGENNSITVYANNPVKIKWHATDAEDSELKYKISFFQVMISEIPFEFKSHDLGNDTSYTFNLDRYSDSLTVYNVKVKCTDSNNQSDTMSRTLSIKNTPENFKPKISWIKLNNINVPKLTVNPNASVNIKWDATDSEDQKLKYQLFIDGKLQLQLFANNSISDTWSEKKNLKLTFSEPKTYKVKVICKDNGGKTDSMTRKIKVEEIKNTKPKMEWLKLNGQNKGITIPANKSVDVKWLGTDKEEDKLKYKLSYSRYKLDLIHLYQNKAFTPTFSTSKTLNVFKESGAYVIKVTCMDPKGESDSITRTIIVLDSNTKPKMEWLKLNGSSKDIKIYSNDEVKIQWYGKDKEDNQIKYQLDVKNFYKGPWTSSKNKTLTFKNPKTYKVKVTCKDSKGKTDSVTGKIIVKKSNVSKPGMASSGAAKAGMSKGTASKRKNTKPKMKWLKLNGKNKQITIKPRQSVKVKWQGTDKEDSKLKYKLSCSRYKQDLSRLLKTHKFPPTEKTSKTLKIFKKPGMYVVKVKCTDKGKKYDSMTGKILVKK